LAAEISEIRTRNFYERLCLQQFQKAGAGQRSRILPSASDLKYFVEETVARFCRLRIGESEFFAQDSQVILNHLIERRGIRAA
jgi:hypothetical protein